MWRLAQRDDLVIIAAEHTNSTYTEYQKEPLPNQSFMGRHTEQFADHALTLWNNKDPRQRVMAMRKVRSGFEPVAKRKVISYDPDTGDVGRWVDSAAIKQDSELAEFLKSPETVASTAESVDGFLN